MPTRPSDIAGLVSWYTATAQYCFSDAGGTQPCGDGDLVQVWKDRQGTNNLSQSTDTLRPTFRNSAGITWVDFDGTRYMDFAGTWFTAAPGSFGLWMRADVSANYEFLSVGVSGSASNKFRMLIANATNKIQTTGNLILN